MEVRRLRSDEVWEWKELRLRALLDSPAAFGTTYEESMARPEEAWVERVQRLAEGRESVMFVADDGGRLVGCAGAYLDPGYGHRPHLISMWVDPTSRGSGVGRALVDGVIRWAREGGHPSVRLDVVDHNAGAIRLYERCGFRPTGRAVPLPREPSVMEIEMELELA